MVSAYGEERPTVIDGTQNATDTLDDANFVVRPLSRRLLIGGGAALGWV